MAKKLFWLIFTPFSMGFWLHPPDLSSQFYSQDNTLQELTLKCIFEEINVYSSLIHELIEPEDCCFWAPCQLLFVEHNFLKHNIVLTYKCFSVLAKHFYIFWVIFEHFLSLNFCKCGPDDLKLSENMQRIKFRKFV